MLESLAVTSISSPSLTSGLSAVVSEDVKSGDLTSSSRATIVGMYESPVVIVRMIASFWSFLRWPALSLSASVVVSQP